MVKKLLVPLWLVLILVVDSLALGALADQLIMRQKLNRLQKQLLEVKNPELSAHLVATRIAAELERRLPHRRVVSKALERIMQSGALGAKIVLAGRINGAEISRVEKFQDGSVPTQTLRENIDYAQIPALLKRGYVGVKVWIHKKEDQ